MIIELLLSNETSIRRINRKFQRYFSYLKFFLRHKHKAGGTSKWESGFSKYSLPEEAGGSIRSGLTKIAPVDTSADVLLGEDSK